MTNFYDLIAHRSQAGDRFLIDANNQTIANYQELQDISAQYANYLRQLGLKKGDRVMVQVEKSAECLFLYFACLRAGLIYLPLNTAYQRHELEYFVGNAQPRLIVCTPENKALFCEFHQQHLLTLTDENPLSTNIQDQSKTFENVPCADSDVAVILYTSGTTGQPKGAMITHGNLSANGTALYQAWDWQATDVLLHSLPIFHIHGLFIAIHCAVLNASPIIFLPRFDSDQIIELLDSATVYMGVPTHYTRLLNNSKLNPAACKNMRLFTSGSAPLLDQTFIEFEARSGHQIVERYGMTETGINSSNPIDGPRKPGTVGLPLAGVSCKIVDPEGQPVNHKETGDLLVKGANVFAGYWQMPEKTQEEFTADGYFKTGDLATMDGDGYLSIVGRNKDMIISGGLNIYPKEIETVIDQLPGIIESAVIGVPHADFGEAVIGIVVVDENTANAKPPNGEAIIAHLKQTLANFKVAKRVFFLTELPRNTMGKVQKNMLRKKYIDTFDVKPIG